MAKVTSVYYEGYRQLHPADLADQVPEEVSYLYVSDAIEIAQAEGTEDMQLMVGLSGEERILTPWPKSLAHRLPWLP